MNPTNSYINQSHSKNIPKRNNIEVSSNMGPQKIPVEPMVPINTIGPPPKPRRGQQILLERDTVVMGSDYDNLTNLPSINNVELKGDLTVDQLGINMETLGLTEIQESEIETWANEIFGN